MKSLLSLLLALVPLSLAAQPVVSPPVVLTESFTHPDSAVDRIAIAGDAKGALVAWADAGDNARIRVADLVTRATFDIPTTSDDRVSLNSYTPVLPALAKRGDTYVLAWADPVASPFFPFPIVQTLSALRLESTGRPFALAPARGPFFSDVVAPMNVLVAATDDGFRFYSVDIGLTSETRADASLNLDQSRLLVRWPVAAVAATSRTLAYSSPVYVSGLLISPPPPSDFYVWSRPIAATNESETVEVLRRPFLPPAHMQTAIATNGDGFLAVWREPFDIVGLRLDRDGRAIGAPFTIASGTRTSMNNPQMLHLAVSWNGSQYVAAWERFSIEGHGDVLGATISENGVVLSQFNIAATEEDERMPALAGGGGRTFVAYALYGLADSRIATRTITTGQPRVRAARPR
jgi:hypothetical protein